MRFLIFILFATLTSCNSVKKYVSAELPNSIEVVINDARLDLDKALVGDFMNDLNNSIVLRERKVIPDICTFNLIYNNRIITFISDGTLLINEDVFINTDINLLKKYWNIEEENIPRISAPQRIDHLKDSK